MEKVLESLSAHPRFKNVLLGSFFYGETMVSVTLDPDGGEINNTIVLAKKFLRKFEAYEQKAVSKIVDEFFELYNEDWRDDEKPIIAKAEFISKLKLTDVSFLSDTVVEFYYEEGGMFGHHALIAQVFDGESFDDATMFG